MNQPLSRKDMAMRLYGVRLTDFDFDKDPELIKNVVVTLPYGWYVILMLQDVNEQQFNALHALTTLPYSSLNWEGVYRHANGIVQIQVHGEINQDIRRGALWDPEVALDLGNSLYENLLAQLQPGQ